MSGHCSPGAAGASTAGSAVGLDSGTRRIALIGSPNAGKTTLFNALTGLNGKTGNYPGVTVARYEGRVALGARDGSGEVLLEDLPGTYSLDPISPDEQVVADLLDPAAAERPDALVVVLDATTLQRSLPLLAQVLAVGLPTLAVLTFTDELTRRQGRLDVTALQRAVGVRVLPVVAGERSGAAALRSALGDLDADPDGWPSPAVPPPTAAQDSSAWASSVLTAAGWSAPDLDRRTQRLDAVLLHPVGGTAIFLATMYAFFQVVFTVAAPAQGWVESLFAWLGGQATSVLGDGTAGRFVADGLIAGVGGVVVFLPQIVLLFTMLSLLEGVGYMARAAFLMDRVMAKAGLEGRAFVALLSSVACAVPGIMATRTLPSARDRIATIMAAPLMTCSARLPVYVLLIGLVVPSDAGWGPFGAQGTVMFAMYLLGAVSAMLAAWVVQRLTGRSGMALPFYMEIPTYRMPDARSVGRAVWDSARTFLRKVGVIIAATTAVLWLLLNVPAPSAADLHAAGVDTGDQTAVAAYTLDHSIAADVGRGLEPVFAPQGFDWRINVGVVSSLAAREVFVATLGQIAAADDPEHPDTALASLTTVRDGAVEPLFTPGVLAALLIFFAFALQCMSTIAVMRRETGGWRWPAIAFGSLFVVAWSLSASAAVIVDAIAGAG